MKLLLISVKSEISKGGIAVWTDKFMRMCDSHGIRSHLVNTEAVGLRAVQGTAKRSIRDEFVRSRRIFRDLSDALKQETFDAAHLNTSCGNFGLFRDYLIACCIKKKKIPLITHYHCDIPFWIHNPVSRRCLEALVRISDRNLVLCENSLRYLEREFDAEAIMIPNFIEDTLILGKPKTIREKIEKVFFAGRVSKNKGAMDIYALAKQFPKIRFELAGEVTQEAESWEKPENVFLLGMISHAEIIKHMDEADLFLLPSYSEGFSLSLMESMARGVPAIATDVGANADMMRDGCGVVVPAGDTDALLQALFSLMNENKRRNISKNAVDRVQSEYSVNMVLRRLEKIYDC